MTIDIKRPRLRLRATAVLSAAAALAVACSSVLVLDDNKLQTEIAAGIQEQAGLSAEVNCPDGQPIMKDAVFECTATTSDGRTVTIKVTQTDELGNVTWEVTAVN